jgi:hypothetical protein
LLAKGAPNRYEYLLKTPSTIARPEMANLFEIKAFEKLYRKHLD